MRRAYRILLGEKTNWGGFGLREGEKRLRVGRTGIEVSVRTGVRIWKNLNTADQVVPGLN